ncbi:MULTISPECIES: ATP-binding protein [Streptomyces]|uniref:ATP-binding protein n=1 Tax=Streptomyces TaxID=1883 RepID=UPI0022495379|nr:ATP-binding protein [Streptomyces sp. JHD 1]MCX2967782.1 ATP-binding protein [Streptomyces sp. JHD 1]
MSDSAMAHPFDVPPFRCRVPHERGALARTREHVRRVLAEWRCPREQTGTVVLLVSELVTNVHRHAGGPAELELCLRDGLVRVAVGDASVRAPAVREPGLQGGFGMHLVERLSSAWGVCHLPDGKEVWAAVAP